MKGDQRCSYTEGVQRLFPHDTLLVAMQIEEYIGVPLFDSAGTPLGLLVALYTRKIPNVQHASSLFHVFSVRAATEFERKRGQSTLQRSTERLQVLHQMNRAILAAQSPQAIAQIAREHLWQFIPCWRLSVSLSKETEKLLTRLLPEDVEIQIDCAAGESWIKADVAQLQQVLTNLAVNARDAIPTDSVLEFHLTQQTINAEQPSAPSQYVPSWYWIVLEVHDTGTGMSNEGQARLLEPFFSTTEVGKGTRLGLS